MDGYSGRCFLLPSSNAQAPRVTTQLDEVQIDMSVAKPMDADVFAVFSRNVSSFLGPALRQAFTLRLVLRHLFLHRIR
jgi:hypothetical protein